MALHTEFFDQISFLELTDQHKEEVAKKIIADIETNKLYRLELILSCAIATFGLLINSTPVVIGAMLIAPILTPIQAFSFAISTGNTSLYMRSLWILVMSMVLTAVCAYGFTFLVPFADTTTEILARTSPTLLDLLIALASGAVAFLSLGFKKLSESLAWVAMAASLIPPLCVVWIGGHFLDALHISQGSALLFAANLIAIVVIGVFFFYAYGFFPTNSVWQRNSFLQIIVVCVSIALVALPLWGSMIRIADDANMQKTLLQTVRGYLPSVDNRVMLEDYSYQKKDETLLIDLEMTIPEWVLFSQKNQQELTALLSQDLSSTVELSLDLIPLTTVFLDEEQELSLVDQTANQVREFLSTSYPEVSLVRLDDDALDDAIISLSLYNHGETIDKDVLRDELVASLWMGDEMIILLSLQQSAQHDLNHQLLQETFAVFFPDARLQDLRFGQEERDRLVITDVRNDDLSGESWQREDYETIQEWWMVINIRYQTQQKRWYNQVQLEKRKNILERALEMPVVINADVSYFDTISL